VGTVHISIGKKNIPGIKIKKGMVYGKVHTRWYMYDGAYVIQNYLRLIHICHAVPMPFPCHAMLR
jgi:hypothetical protein